MASPSQPKRALVIVLVASAFSFLGGCTSSHGNADAGTDANEQPPDGDAAITCQRDPRLDAFAPNLKKTGGKGAFSFVYVSGDPESPTRGTNKWKLQLLDGSGHPTTTPAIEVKPFMPDHGHGTSIKAKATPEGDAYTIAPLYFFMPGLWQVTFTATQDATTDEAVFTVCVPG